jgi:hypothetical protein
MVVVLLLLGCQRYAKDLISGVARFRHRDWHVVAVSGGLAAGEEARWKEIAGADDPLGAVSMLRLPAPDTYAGLAEKVFAALRAIVERFGDSLRGVFKTDDDIVFEPPPATLATFLAKRGGDQVTWGGVKTAIARGGRVAESRLSSRGHSGSLPPAEKLVYPAVVYCYGAGYWLRADKIKMLLAACGDPPCVLEDVSIGIVMNRMNEVPVRFGDITYRELPRA